MVRKKLKLLTALLCLTASGAFAQLGSSYDVKDSSLISKKNLPQHNEFLNNAYPYPAKPRNQWEVGVKGGWSAVAGDVRYQGLTGGAGISVRKALGYVFSLRAEYDWMRSKGLNFSPSVPPDVANSAWSAYAPGQVVFYNYRTTIQELSLQGVVTLNNIRFHKAKTGFNLYAFGGIAGMIYDTKVDALDGNGNPYTNLFTTVNNNYSGQFTYENRKDIRKALKDGMDKSYETHAETDVAQPKLFGQSFKPAAVVGMGVQFKLSKKLNLQFEDKYTIVKSDLIDGQQWQAAAVAGAPGTRPQGIMTRDFDSYNFLSVGLNFNLGGKSVEPLWWLNPLDYAYNEINAPRHMKLPKPVLDDADGDGVTDQFDLEPNTPAGAPVDSHGVSKDTDGDGVPDYKDKELITPTQCQPVDADGVGKCPEPPCCQDIRNNMMTKPAGCGIGDLPSVSFGAKSVSLSKDAKAVLAGVAQKMKDNANCKVAVVGYGESSKSAQQLSWDRVNAVINYLVEKEGINADRLIFKYGEGGGDANTVDLRDGSGEEGPNTVPAPHPNLRKK
ncbi:OmpA family protein [Pinibacter aurantiacus]|uniref:OmpA family protein n=1 Tax=Pinibacter aurantiacus TaxID=2851599 RepID=A0A9E2SB89_9BACT|nr:OmpA family protein [Pinibacter aurantiacus]MBV4358132.1 OmpA family protein [Pinibacter aurantiacus]